MYICVGVYGGVCLHAASLVAGASRENGEERRSASVYVDARPTAFTCAWYGHCPPGGPVRVPPHGTSPPSPTPWHGTSTVGHPPLTMPFSAQPSHRRPSCVARSLRGGQPAHDRSARGLGRDQTRANAILYHFLCMLVHPAPR